MSSSAHVNNDGYPLRHTHVGTPLYASSVHYMFYSEDGYTTSPIQIDVIMNTDLLHNFNDLNFDTLGFTSCLLKASRHSSVNNMIVQYQQFVFEDIG